MEGAGYIRSHSEKVELRTNIFSDDAEAAAPNEENVYVDEDGNPIDLAELAELGDLEGIEDTLAEQMKIIKAMQNKDDFNKLQNLKDIGKLEQDDEYEEDLEEMNNDYED